VEGEIDRMRKILISTALSSIFLCFLSTFAFSLNVVTTINPYYLIVKEITNGKANLSLIVKAGADPHSYSPTVTDVKAISKADLIVANGLGLDDAYLKGYKNVLYVGLCIPTVQLGLNGGLEAAHTGNETEVEGVNPHVWLSLDFFTQYIIPSIRDTLMSADKLNAQFYKQNADVLLKSISTLSRKFDLLLSGYRNSVVVLDHPSYFYIFKKYGITILSVEEGHNKQPTISHIKEIINQSKQSKLLGIFVGPQFNRSAIETISRELKRKYYVLDPLGVDAKSITDLFNKAYKVLQEAINEK